MKRRSRRAVHGDFRDGEVRRHVVSAEKEERILGADGLSAKFRLSVVNASVA